MKKSRLLGAVCAFVISFITIPSYAALIDRGGGLIYDDVLDVTWLQDANYAMTSGYDTDGLLTWAEANTWASNLSYYDTVRDVIYDDWRLPTASPINGISFDMIESTDGTTDRGFTSTTTDGSDGGWRDGTGNPVSEMGYMYYVNLGNLGQCDPDLPWCTYQTGWGLSNTGPFINLLPKVYWSDTELDISSSLSFNFIAGFKGTVLKQNDLFAWAVRAGDISSVPIPPALWLFCSGLLGLIGVARQKGSISNS